MGCSPPGSSVHGILWARILERVAISFSTGSYHPRNQTGFSCIAGEFFTLQIGGTVVLWSRGWAAEPSDLCFNPTSITHWWYNWQVPWLLCASVTSSVNQGDEMQWALRGLTLAFCRPPSQWLGTVTRRWYSAGSPLWAWPWLRQWSLLRSHPLPWAAHIQWLINKDYQGLNLHPNSGQLVEPSQLQSSLWGELRASLGFHLTSHPTQPCFFSSLPQEWIPRPLPEKHSYNVNDPLWVCSLESQACEVRVPSSNQNWKRHIYPIVHRSTVYNR